MKFIFLLILPIFLFGSKILSYNVYERSNHVDIMITFDTPYEGKLSQSKQNSTLILKLQNASIESPKIKNLKTSYLRKMTITPINSRTEIILETADDIHMSASKTSDAYGLRLRFTKGALTSKTKTSASTTSLPTKTKSDFKNSYYIVIAILLAGIILMFWIKKKVSNPSTKGKQPWLFKGGAKKEGVSIRFQKPLDTKNRVVMLDFEGNSYLVVIGTSNVLLDKYNGDQAISTQSEFDDLLNKNKGELDSYLQLDTDDIEPLESYKDKASSSDFRELA